MKSSLLILTCFLAGLLGGALGRLPANWSIETLTLAALYALLFLVGIGVGSSGGAWPMLRRAGARILLVPLGVVVGTLLGTAVVAAFLPGVGLREGLAVGAGFGYYSLSSVIIGQLRGEMLGVVALLANIMREMFTLLATPLLARRVGRLAPIAAGGATAMDTTLPIITRFSGNRYGVIAVFSGLALTVLVPFLVTLILTAGI